jgi:hypothetical protein
MITRNLMAHSKILYAGEKWRIYCVYAEVWKLVNVKTAEELIVPEAVLINTAELLSL